MCILYSKEYKLNNIIFKKMSCDKMFYDNMDIDSITNVNSEPIVNSLDNPVFEGTINLISKDDVKFTVEKKNAVMSGLIKTSLESDLTVSELHLSCVEGDILKYIVDFMNHHAGEDIPLVSRPLSSKYMKDVVVDQWDAVFIDQLGENLKKLYDVILCANYLDIRGLLHLGCAKTASLIKGQPLEKIKEILDPNGKSESLSTATDNKYVDGEDEIVLD
jgi:S-phase kinase-associated protein 1